MGNDDLMIESRFKYGKSDEWENSADDFAAALNGNPAPRPGDRRPAVAPPQGDDEMDASAIIQRAYTANHYGGE